MIEEVQNECNGCYRPSCEKKWRVQLVESPHKPHQEARSLSIRPKNPGSKTNDSNSLLDLVKQILLTGFISLSARDWSSGSQDWPGLWEIREEKLLGQIFVAKASREVNLLIIYFILVGIHLYNTSEMV